MKHKIIFGIVMSSLVFGSYYYASEKINSYSASILNADVHSVTTKQVQPLSVEQSPAVSLEATSDIETPQDGESFLLKLSYTNNDTVDIDRTTLATLVKNNDGFLLERFSNGSTIEANGGSIVNSIRLPNVAGETFHIECESEECSPFSITIPSGISTPEVVQRDEEEEIDFVVKSARIEPADAKMKVTIGYAQLSHDEVKAGLSYQYTLKGDGDPVTLIGDTPEKMMPRDEVFYSSFYIQSNPQEIEIILDPQARINDPNRKNNLLVFQSIKEEGDTDLEGIDFSIIRARSSIVDHEGKPHVKLQVGYRYDGAPIVDTDGLDMHLSFPYLDSLLQYEDITSTDMTSGDVATFTHYLPLSFQASKVRIALDPLGVFDDRNRDNNYFETKLASVSGESFVDFRIMKSEARVINQDGIQMVKVYTEYMHESDSPATEGVDIHFYDLQGTPLSYFESTGEELIHNQSYTNITYFPWSSDLEMIEIEIDSSKSYRDPLRANNSAYVSIGSE